MSCSIWDYSIWKYIGVHTHVRWISDVWSYEAFVTLCEDSSHCTVDQTCVDILSISNRFISNPFLVPFFLSFIYTGQSIQTKYIICLSRPYPFKCFKGCLFCKFCLVHSRILGLILIWNTDNGYIFERNEVDTSFT